MNTHDTYMNLALEQAQIALKLNEVPVGCVIIKDDKVVGQGYNTRETSKNALGHAELMAIDNACKILGSWRLSGCTLYVTLEPCPMCMGAIINSRIDTVVFVDLCFNYLNVTLTIDLELFPVSWKMNVANFFPHSLKN